MKTQQFVFLFCFPFLVSCQQNPSEQTKNDSAQHLSHISDISHSPTPPKENATEDSEENSTLLYELNDSMLLCYDGAFPFYVAHEDSTCSETLLYPDGKLKAKGKCSNGKKSGLWISYFENGNVRSKGIIKNGFPIGQWVFFYSNGNKKSEGEFIPGQFELGCAGSENFRAITIRNGKWTCWFEDGQLNLNCVFKPDENKLETLNGLYTEWFANGKKEEEGMYRNGNKNQTWTYWYKSGKKEREEKYKYQDCGQYDYVSFECPTGKWSYWKEDGSLAKTEVYVDGKTTDEQ